MAASSLGSAPLPDPGPDDHIRGAQDGPVVIEYGDFECPYCALLDQRIADLPVRRVFRHFPVRSSHPRAWAASFAAEAAALQGRYWEMHDALFAQQDRLEDPHLWERAQQLGLDLERFDSDRRSDVVRARVRRDFESGVRAGVVSTPTLFAGEAVLRGRISREELSELTGPESPTSRRSNLVEDAGA